MRSLNPLTIEGRWHITGEDQPAPYGKLFCDPDGGLRLEVKITQAKTVGEILSELSSNPMCQTPLVIQGFDHDNNPVRLFDCIAEEDESSLGLMTIRYSVQRAIKGIGKGDWPSIESKTFALGFSILDCWMHPAGPPRHSANYKAPGKHTIPGLFTFYIDSTISEKGDGARSESWWIGLEFDRDIPVAKVDQLHRQHLALLLTILAGKRVAKDSFRFGESGVHEAFRSDLEVLEQRPDDSRITRVALPVYMRTLHRDVTDVLPDMIAKWFSLIADPDMKQVVNLYSALRFHHLFIGAHFLLIAQALEAYHTASGRYSASKWDRAEFSAMMKRVRGALGKDDRSKLGNSLANANSKSFQDKLLEVLSDAPSPVTEVIADRIAFARLVKDNRNAHTHHVGEQSRSRRLDDFTLAGLADQGMALLEMLLLRDIGAPEKAFRQIVREHPSRVRIKLNDIEL